MNYVHSLGASIIRTSMYLVFTQSQTARMSLRQLAPTYVVHNLHTIVKFLTRNVAITLLCNPKYDALEYSCIGLSATGTTYSACVQ